MATIALISEGITDQIILDRIIGEFCDEADADEFEINPLQPARDATDEARAESFGGWELVLEYCKLPGRIEEALAANDYVLIQIDTDCGDHENFGLGLTRDGADKDYLEIIEGTIQIIANHIGKETYLKHKDRFIFAVSVHSLECWILLSLFNIERTKRGAHHLERELKRTKNGKLSKDEDCYKKLAKKIKAKSLKGIAGSNNSLGFFLSRLSSI